MEFSYEIIVLLFLLALSAGFVDSISGGGGLIVLPVLIMLGFLPAQALATNKLQGIFGKMSAVVYYRQVGMLNIRSMRWPLVASFLGAGLGALAVEHINADALSKLIPWLVAIVAVYLLLSPRVGDFDKCQRLSVTLFGLTVAIVLGFYDGFFGPASGSLFAFSFVSVLGQNLTKATAHTRLLLLATNTASLGVFVWGEKVVWSIGLLMALGQWIGARCGSKVVLLKGSKLVRPMLVSVCFVLVVKMTLFSGT